MDVQPTKSQPVKVPFESSQPGIVSDGQVPFAAQAALGQIVSFAENSPLKSCSDCNSPENYNDPNIGITIEKTAERIENIEYLAAWDRDDLVKLFAGLEIDADDPVFKHESTVIQNYIAYLGFGDERKRFGGAGEVSDKKVIGYEKGFGSVSLCGHLPIPSHGINADGEMFETGASGTMEVFYHGKDERLRQPLTIQEFLHQKKQNEIEKVKRKGMVQCNSWKCLECTLKRLEEAARELKWILAFSLFEFCSYAFATFTLRHFHKKPKLQLDALSEIFRMWDSCGVVKRLKKKHGFIILYRGLELTLDSLMSNSNTGAHPHYHAIFLFLPKETNKKGVVVEYPVPDEKVIAEIQKELSQAWFDCVKKYYDKKEKGKADKHKENILKHGFKLNLYAVDSVPPADVDSGEFLEWQEKKKKFDDHVKNVKQLWDSGLYVMPESVKKFKGHIDNKWKDNKDHFYKQLAGLSDIANYVGGFNKFDICREMTASMSKNGHRPGRVIYMTWFFQAALIHDKRVDALAKSLVKDLYHVKFINKSRRYKHFLKKQYFAMYEDGKLCDVGLTVNELKEDVRVQSECLPEVLEGDRIRLGNYALGSEDLKTIHNFGNPFFFGEVNNRIEEIVKSISENEGIDKGDVEIGREAVKEIFNNKLIEIQERKPNFCAGRGSPVIPSYIYESLCWDPVLQYLKQQKYKYQEILRLCKKNRPADFVSICRDIISDPEYDGVCGLTFVESVKNLLDFNCFSSFAENRVLCLWRDGLKEKIINHAEIKRSLDVLMPDIVKEQNEAEKEEIVRFLQDKGFNFNFAWDYAKKSSYEKIWRDFYGHYEIREIKNKSYRFVNSGGRKGWMPFGVEKDLNKIKNHDGYVRLGKFYRVEGKIQFDFSQLAFGLGWCPDNINFKDRGLDGLSGWWGYGFNPDAFDIALAGRIRDELDDGFDILDNIMACDAPCDKTTSFVIGQGKGDYAGFALVYVTGWLDQYKIKEQKRLAEEQRKKEQEEFKRLENEKKLQKINEREKRKKQKMENEEFLKRQPALL